MTVGAVCNRACMDCVRGVFVPSARFFCLKQDGQDAQDLQDGLQVLSDLNVYRHQQEQEAKVR